MKIDDYGDENDQKQTNTMPFKSKYTPFRHNYLVKKEPNQPGRGRPPTRPQRDPGISRDPGIELKSRSRDFEK